MSDGKLLPLGIRLWWLGAVLVGVLFVTFAVYLAWGETHDDAAITFAYAKNLVHGEGLVLSPGAEPVEGYTNFLWLVAVAPIIAAGLDVIVGAKVLGIILGLATLYLMLRLPGQVENRGPQPLDFVAPAALAAMAPFALWSVSGLETPLQAFLVVLCVALSFREVKDPNALPFSSLAFVGLALVRPEGAGLWLAALLHRGALAGLVGRRSRMDLWWVLGFVALMAVYHVWHYSYFHELVPNTYFVRAEERSLSDALSYMSSPSDPGFRYVRSFVETYRILAVLPLAGLCLASSRMRYYSLPILMLLAGTTIVVLEGGDKMVFHRFMAPLLPPLFLCAQEGLRSVVDWIRRHGDRIGPLAVPAVTSLGLAIICLPLLGSAEVADNIHRRPFHARYADVSRQAESLKRLEARLGLKQASVLIPDVGAVAYDTDLLIIDIVGLGDHFIARHPEGPELFDYIFKERRPDIISIHQPWVKELDSDPRLWLDYAPVVIRRDAEELRAGVFVRLEHVVEEGTCPDAHSSDDRELQGLVGSRATVQGVVSSARRAETGASLLELDGVAGLSVRIIEPVVADFVAIPERTLLRRAVCATGVLEMQQGILSLRVENKSDILVQPTR